jgi:hypothetical protein
MVSFPSFGRMDVNRENAGSPKRFGYFFNHIARIENIATQIQNPSKSPEVRFDCR